MNKNTGKIVAALEKIQSTGCVVKDLDTGLLDFPAIVNNQEVYLCWRLGEGEIGMLLHNTPGGEARAVATRLKRALQELDDLESSVRVSVGFATREPGQPWGGALAQQAREDALREAQESRQ